MYRNDNLTPSSLIDGLKLMTLSEKQLGLDSNIDRLHTPHNLFTLIIFIPIFAFHVGSKNVSTLKIHK